MWTSLAVQWLRLLLSTQRVQSLVWELRAYMPCNQEIKKIKKKNQKYVFMDRMSYPELYEFGKARELSICSQCLNTPAVTLLLFLF